MKRLLLFLAAGSLGISSAFATAPRIRPLEMNCPYTIIAGANTLCMMVPQMAFTWTVNSMTSVFTVTGGTYTPVNGDVITVDTDTGGTLPSGLFGYTANTIPTYGICSVSGSTFILKESMQFNPTDPCTGTQVTVTDAGTGTFYGSLFDGTLNVFLGQNPTGWPAGTTFTYLAPTQTSECRQTPPTSNGLYYSPGQGAFCISAAVPLGATPGTMTTHIQFCGTNTPSNCTTFDWPIQVIARPSISFTPPGSFTSIPNRAYWEGVMVARPCPGSNCGSPGVPAASVSGPANYCDPLSSPDPVNQLGAATSSGVSFPGWNLLFDNMAIYTGNPVYRTGCFATAMSHGTADTTHLTAGINSSVTTFSVVSGAPFVNKATIQIDMELIYCTTISGNTFSGCIRGGGGGAASHTTMAEVFGADLLGVKENVIGNGVDRGCSSFGNPPGSCLGYAHYTEPLFRAARVLGDSSFFTAGLDMQNNFIIALGPKLSAATFRDDVFGLEDATSLTKYGGLSNPMTHQNDVRDAIYSTALHATESDASGVRFPQQEFILAYSYRAIIHDWQQSKDPRAIYMVKRIADYAWTHYDQVNHYMQNIEGPAPNSPWCANFPLWFVATPDGNCGINPPNFQSDQLLMCGAFWFVYAYTGDTTYRDQGDDWFQHALDSGFLTGKQASSSYWDSFNAVGWRTGTLPITSWFGDAPSPAPSGQVITGNAVLNGQVVFH